MWISLWDWTLLAECKLCGVNGGRVRAQSWLSTQHCVLITPNYCLLARCSYKQHSATHRPAAVSMMGLYHYKLSLLTPSAHFQCRYYPLSIYTPLHHMLNMVGLSCRQQNMGWENRQWIETCRASEIGERNVNWYQIKLFICRENSIQVNVGKSRAFSSPVTIELNDG